MEDSVKNFKPPSVKYMYQVFFSFSHYDIKWCLVSLFCMHFHLSSDFLRHKSEFIPFFWKKYLKNFPRTSPGLILIFLGLQISPVTLSFQRFRCQFSLQSTFSSYMYNINSENFIVQVLADSQQFLGPVVSFQDWEVLENCKIKFQDSPGFPKRVQTLYIIIRIWYRWSYMYNSLTGTSKCVLEENLVQWSLPFPIIFPNKVHIFLFIIHFYKVYKGCIPLRFQEFNVYNNFSSEKKKTIIQQTHKIWLPHVSFEIFNV